MQEFGRIFLELSKSRRESVIDAHEKYALFSIAWFSHESLKSVILCDQQHDRTITFDDLALQTSVFSAVQLQCRVQAGNRSRGDSVDARALASITHEGDGGVRYSNHRTR